MHTVTKETVRVMQIITIGGHVASEEVIWIGDDLDELDRQYPPSEISGADPLGQTEIDDGHIVTKHRFEEFEDGRWLEIEDPRLEDDGPMTNREAAIDAENRRRYPGDYLVEEARCRGCDRYISDCGGC